MNKVSVVAVTCANNWTERNKQQQPSRSARRKEQENPQSGHSVGFRLFCMNSFSIYSAKIIICYF